MIANKSLFKKMTDIFLENYIFIISFFSLNYLTYAWFLIHEERTDVAISYGALLFLIISVVTLVLNLIKYKFLLRMFKAFLLLLFFIPFCIEFFSMYNYKALLGTGIITAILQTNVKEMQEFFSMYFSLKDVGVIAPLVLIFFLFLYFSKPYFTHLYQKAPKILTIFLLFLAVYALKMPFMYLDFFHVPPLPMERLYFALAEAKKNIEAYDRLVHQTESHVTLTENNSTIKNVVFILGESMNRNHMHLYGYYLPNTPRLDKLNAEGDLCVFQNIVSPHSTTIAVLSELFTFCHHESDKPWYEYNNLIDVLNKAGYKTHWLSNQESSGVWGNVAQLYANKSTVHHFTRIRDSKEDTGILDEELFPLVDDAIKNRSLDKNFYVIHLMGAHGLYYNRYSSDFNKFSAKDIKLDVTEKQKEVISEYDNAIYYNDYIVDTIMHKFQDEEALVIYVPDHSEAVYDEGDTQIGHIEENPTKNMIEIPVVVWASASFRDKYPQKWQSLQEASTRPYMTDDMIHTMLDLLDIRTPEFESTRSIINNDFDPTRKRIFHNLDYDEEILRGKN